MAQNVTISLTLPLSCQICLGKVRQPVICSNNHVFCSCCIELWLKNANQCPTCRVSITPENPCKEIIGATDERETNEDPSIKKKLRKTRSELLLREYEDEIETLHRENEELKDKCLQIEAQNKYLSCVCTGKVEEKEMPEEKRVDVSMLEEWKSKLEAATNIYKKVKLDMEKVEQANRTLRAQNIDLVRENLQLKAEVDKRSPQKFGRYTVAALEAKVRQYERDQDQLRKALERSDKYVEELEARVSAGIRMDEKKGVIGNHEDITENQSNGSACSTTGEHTRVVTMRRSLSEMEGAFICTNPFGPLSEFSGASSFLLKTSTDTKASGLLSSMKNVNESECAEKRLGGLSLRFSQPSTPSSSLSCLSLASPRVNNERNTIFKPLSFMRRLSFDDCQSSSSVTTNKSLEIPTFVDHLNSSRSVFWGCNIKPNSPGLETSNKQEPDKNATLQAVVGCDAEDLGTSSEASMDAAYLDKVSELDSLISECEAGEVSHYSFSPMNSAEFDTTLMPELNVCVDLEVQDEGGKCGTTSDGAHKPGGTSDHANTSNTQQWETPSLVHTGMSSVLMEAAACPSNSQLDFSNPDAIKSKSNQLSKRKTPGLSDVESPSKMSKLH